MQLLLNQATGNATLHNGRVVLLVGEWKLQLGKIRLGKYQLPVSDFGG